MKENEKTVKKPQDCCPHYERGLWSLDEEPAICDTCRFYEEPCCERTED